MGKRSQGECWNCRGVLLFDFAQSSEPVELQYAPTNNLRGRGDLAPTKILLLYPGLD